MLGWETASTMLLVRPSAKWEVLATLYVGLDVHKSYVYAVPIDETGRKCSSGRLNNDRATLRTYVDSLPDCSKVVMEACYGWPFVYDASEGQVESIVLSHPKRTKAVA